MTVSHLLKLIPFYSAKTLDAEEKKAIDEELPKSRELQEELKFWQRAAHATRSSVEFLRHGHPSPEEIVDYVEENIRNIQTRSTAEKHFQECDNCRQELEIIKETYPIPQASRKKESSIIASVLQYLKPIKPAYAIPAVAVIVICTIIVVSEFSGPTDKHAALTLQYEPQVRDPNAKRELPTLNVEDNITAVDLTIMVPASVDSTRYALSLISPSGIGTLLPDTLQPSSYHQAFDTLNVVLTRDHFIDKGNYQLIATEVLTPTAISLGLTPTPYRCPFIVSSGISK